MNRSNRRSLKINPKLDDKKLDDTKIVDLKKEEKKINPYIEGKIYNIHIVETNKVEKHPHRYHLYYIKDGVFKQDSPSSKLGFDIVEKLYKLGLTRQLVQEDLSSV